MTEPNENILLKKGHSRLGIASVIMSVAIPVILILFLIVSLALGTRRDSVGNYFAMAFAGFGLVAPVLHLVGMVLGLSGLISKRTKNLFPVIGIILNIFLGVLGVVIIFLIITNITWGFR